MSTIARVHSAAFAGLLAAVIPVVAQNLTVAVRVGYETHSVAVPVSAAEAPGIAAMACVAAFDTASLNVSADSLFFGSFADQYRQSGVAEPTEVTAVIGGVAFDAPFLVRPHPEGIGIAGARRSVLSDSSPVLFTLHVALKPGAPPGVYPITLRSVSATNPDAGYPPGGVFIPLLVGHDPEGGVYPVIAASTPGHHPVTDGSVRFFPADSDGDGLADEWELRYYPNLTTANALTDTDRDGIPDLLEQAFGTNPHVADGSQVIAVPPVAGWFAIRFPLSDHAAIHVEWSTGGTDWSSLGITLTPRPDLGTGPDWQMQEAKMPTADRPRILMRVRGNPSPVPAGS